MNNVASTPEEIDTVGYKKFDIHEGIIFCIELSGSMFKEVPELNRKIQLIEILESLKELMTRLIIIHPNTAIACYFHYSNKVEAESGIYEFFPLEDLNGRNLKKLTDLLEDIHRGRVGLEDFFKYDENESVPLDVLFNHLREQFIIERPGQRGFQSKRILLFTDNDFPKQHQDREARQRIRRIIEDLNDIHVNITTFFIGSEKKPFNSSFYADILRLGSEVNSQKNSEFDGYNANPIPASYIKSKVMRRKEIQRINFRCPLVLDENAKFIIGIKGYSIVSHEKAGTRYKLVYEHESTRAEAFSKRKFLNSTTGEEMKPEDTFRVFKYGDLNIELSDKEIMNIKEEYTGSESFLKLIGFRSVAKSLHYYNNIDKASFLVPDEDQFTGSIKAIASLFRTLKRKSQLAIVWGRPKVNSSPSLYIINPSAADDINEGFYLYRVPFINEIRRLPSLLTYDNGCESEDFNVLLDITENIIKEFDLKDGYIPQQFKNPSLQKFYNLLHDYLLQVEDVKSNSDDAEASSLDDTLLKLHEIKNRILKSESSSDNFDQKLSKYFKAWNYYYSKMNKCGSNLDDKKMSYKRPKFELNL